MTEKPLHPIGALHDAISGCLGDVARIELEGHLAGCESCRREFEMLSAVKWQLAGSAAAPISMPHDLDRRLREVLDVEDRVRAAAVLEARPPVARWRWIGWAAAAAAAVVLAIVLVQRGSFAPAPPEEVAADLRRYAAGTLPIDTPTRESATLDTRLAAAGLGFAARVFDFDQMSFFLTGGGIHSVGGQQSALFVYDGPDRLRLLCQMYLGSVEDLPPPDDRRTNAGIEFLVYRQDDVTVVFWQEADGRVVCALAANGDPETAVRFAFAKAVGPVVS